MLILFRNIVLQRIFNLSGNFNMLFPAIAVLCIGQFAVWGVLTPKTSEQEVASNSQINWWVYNCKFKNTV